MQCYCQNNPSLTLFSYQYTLQKHANLEQLQQFNFDLSPAFMPLAILYQYMGSSLLQVFKHTQPGMCLHLTEQLYRTSISCFVLGHHGRLTRQIGVFLTSSIYFQQQFYCYAISIEGLSKCACYKTPCLERYTLDAAVMCSECK